MIPLKNKELTEEYNTFIQNIKYYRQKNCYTQEVLAEKADLSISYIKQIESGSEFKNVSLTTLLKLSNALNVRVRDLFIKK